MASIFASALRTQARATLFASRARLVSAAPAAARSFGLIASRHAANTATPSFARALSSSKALSADYGGYERTERPPSPPNNTVYVGNLPYTMQEVEIEEFMSTFGPIVQIRMGTRPDGSPKGFAHIEFTNLADATKLIEAHADEPLFIAGRTVRVDYAPKRNQPVTTPYHKLYIYDFPHDQETLRQMFSAFDSDILSVFMLQDKVTGKPLGSGFVEFKDIAQATDALNELNGQEIDGTTLKMSYARPPKPREARSYGGDYQQDRSGGGGFSRGGRGGGFSGGRGGREGGYQGGGGRNGGYSGGGRDSGY